MVASILIRSIIDNRTGVSRGNLGNLRGFLTQRRFGEEFNAKAQRRNGGRLSAIVLPLHPVTDNNRIAGVNWLRYMPQKGRT